MKKIIIIVLLLSIVSGIAFFLYSSKLLGRSGSAPQQITITFWGLWENATEIQPAIDAYQKAHPNVKINYVHQSSINYRQRVQNQIVSGQGPDIYMIHDTWVPMFLSTNSMSTVPADVMNEAEFTNTFYPVAKNNLTKGDKIYALPLEIDGLALYYNADILNAAGVSVPKYWFQTSDDPGFINDSVKMTVKDTQGNIKTAGAAMGSTNNVDHWPDIIGLLFSQQPSASLEQPNSKAGQDVLNFFTGFVINPQTKTWDTKMEASTQAFEEGKLAFYFAPSWRAFDIRAKNPNLNFKVAPVPQLPLNPQVGWASFWAFSVSSQSQNQKEAWNFLKYLTSQDSETLLYKTASSTRLFGEPYSRVDLASQLKDDPLVGAFVNQGPYYTSWYLSSNTLDNGINDQMIQYYGNMVDSMVKDGKSASDALTTYSPGIQQVLQTFTNPQVAPSASGK